MRLCCEVSDEIESLGNHEAAGSGFLDRITNCIEANRANPGGVKLLKDRVEVSFAFGVMHIDIDLIAGKVGPQKALLAFLELVLCERQTRTRPVQLKQLGFARAGSKHL